MYYFLCENKLLIYNRDCHEMMEVYMSAMTDAERQRRRRKKLSDDNLKPLLVVGNNGEFDPRIRIALAVKELALNNEIPSEIIEKIAKISETVMETKQFNKPFINKIILDFLRER